MLDLSHWMTASDLPKLLINLTTYADERNAQQATGDSTMLILLFSFFMFLLTAVAVQDLVR